ncbi:succinate dehydrogenase, cytochrome b556 subunit [Pelomicrobium sp.]|jgi:succinate dehydrogenase / fumarate reductase cytochrome b subunit|uniref:succinate dehydrogenase, cytochrome b556 subunit n=1 Tax=Pelomicrobium sp. TaxID=2815319 RepID=UPI002FDCCF8F
MAPKNRPKYLDLLHIKLPVPGLVSILHRVSGALLFLFIPVFLFFLQTSLVSAEGFEAVRRTLDFWPVKLGVIGLVWAFLHHFFAGLRYLAIDLHYGVELAAARASAKAVLAASLALTLILGAILW